MHKLIYNGEEIPYQLTRKKIKNLYISIKDGKVTVKAPMRLKEKYIYEFLEKKVAWVYKAWQESLKNKENNRKINNEEIEKLEKTVKEEIENYSKILNVRPKKVRIKDIKYAWRKLLIQEKHNN